MNDREWLNRAVELARRAPASPSAFSVGAVIVLDGEAVGEGWSRAEDPADHAEEVALRQAGELARGAAVYSSMEPCGLRSSRPRPCARLLIEARVAKVVYAAAEPETFVQRTSGDEQLRAAGVEVVVMPDLAGEALAANEHLPGLPSAE
ncbi:deaminase [Salininema proteolyticum]|uniref:Deaminase n=1 Tax=Salininema proteolyticum TaxID=1607685 RepID=A0ABV8U003_9ACTN